MRRSSTLDMKVHSFEELVKGIKSYLPDLRLEIIPGKTPEVEPFLLIVAGQKKYWAGHRNINLKMQSKITPKT